MLENKKVMNDMSCAELLNYAEAVKKEGIMHYYNSKMIVDETFLSYENLEKSAYTLAVERANTAEALEKCAKAIELHGSGDDSDEWAEQIRIEAYGIEWYLKKYFNSSAFEEFLSFTHEMGINNPLKELEGEL